MWWLRDLFSGAVRVARSHPSAVVTVVASLTLGLALLTAVASLFDSVFLRPWPLPDSEALVVVDTQREDSNGEYRGPFKWSYPDYQDLRQASTAVAQVAIYQDWPMSLAGASDPFRGRGMFVSTNYFEVLGIEASHGRLLGEIDGRPEASPAVVLTHGTWRRRFAADPSVVGQTLRVNGRPMTVVGVGPPGFHGTEVPIDVDFWMPVELYRQVGPYPEWFDVRGTSFFTAIARLEPGVSREQAVERWRAFAVSLEEDHPKAAKDLWADARPLLEASFPRQERSKNLEYGEALIVGALLVLFVCAVNTALLVWGLAAARRRELAIRGALGAPGARLMGQVLTEMLGICVVVAVLAWPAAWTMLRLLSTLRPPNFPRDVFLLALDPVVFLLIWLLTTAIALAVTALAFGRPGTPRDGGLLSLASRRASGERRGPALLVALQFALACVALVASLLFVRALQRSYDVPLGFDHDRVMVTSVAPGEVGWDEDRSQQFYRRVRDEVVQLAQVESAAWSENRLLRGAVWQRSIFLEGAEDPLAVGSRAIHRTNVVSPEFFDVAGIELQRGDGFRDDLAPDAPWVAIINRTFADVAWPGQDAVGQRFRFDHGTEGPQVEVRGVVADAKYRHVEEASQAFVYLPMSQHFKPAMTLHVRGQDPDQLLVPVRGVIQGIAPDLPLADVAILRAFVDEDLWLPRVSATVLASFAGVSWLLAALGVYGVLAHAVARQQRDLGIRRSLGASAWQLGSGLLRTTAWALGLGCVLGGVLSFVLLRSAEAFHERWAELLDVSGLATLVLLLLAAAAAGFWIPFQRARGVDPARLLREE